MKAYYNNIIFHLVLRNFVSIVNICRNVNRHHVPHSDMTYLSIAIVYTREYQLHESLTMPWVTVLRTWFPPGKY